MQTTLEFSASDTKAGFRLERLEVFNWGTFDRAVWDMNLDGDNALLTGDIGSGKSTIVDAVTTLLVPHQRIVYNRAAGAESRERTLYSYVRGEYKSEKDELSQSAKAVALREKNTYSVLLAYFYNEGLRQGITIAQVFWLKENRKTPEKFFVTAEKDLSVKKDFDGFGDDINTLRKNLRNSEHVKVMDNFKEYCGVFRHFFGIKNDQALNLFYQTVSMKSIGNLTDFVRHHMLEKYEVKSRIETLSRNFDNLNQAHQTVLLARRQIELLSPLAQNARRFARLTQVLERQIASRDALDAFFADIRVGLLGKHIDGLGLEIEKLSLRLEKSRQSLNDFRLQSQNLKASIEKEGGGRIRQVEQEIERLEREKKRKLENRKLYLELVKALELDGGESDQAFLENRRSAEELQSKNEARNEALSQDILDRKMDVRDFQLEEGKVKAELTSLEKRKSNIPLHSLRIRQAMSETLNVPEENLPFIGELIQVSEQDKPWEGAIERLLHNFGLSLLIPDELYGQVSRYVERTHLKGRLVYFRVTEDGKRQPAGQERPNSLIRKLNIKSDSTFYRWLDGEVRRRFDYVCCESMDEFHHEPRALSKQGQIKSSSVRHEKDDRHSLEDRSRYILGWDNLSKIEALKNRLKIIQDKGLKAMKLLGELDRERVGLVGARDKIRDLLNHGDFAELNWGPLAEEIQVWMAEKKELEKSSDLLRDLQKQLDGLHLKIDKEEERKDSITIKKGRQEQALDQAVADRKESEQMVQLLPGAERDKLFVYLELYRQKALGAREINLKNLDISRRETREYLQRKLIEACRDKINRLQSALVSRMKDYRHSFPAESSEMGSDLDSLPDYAVRLASLRDEDLPRHEARFKEMLNKETINSIALFQNQLEKEYQDILDKIRSINLSLREIEYNPGSYIELVGDQAPDVEIRDFRESLRQCLSHGLSQDDLYNENKFLQVKDIIDRFNGREGSGDLDKRWTDKVTDVRNWFSFSAVERWREDDSEKEYYSDSAGKSGGQKEKLAYTILASALAYQFGLEWNTIQSRSFRFVVIDEAFGKGSDDSTRFGLELFKKLNLQLLIVTPLQKIHVIEDYVHSVHFVHNEGGKNSVLQNMSISDYKQNKDKYQKSLAGQAK